MGDSEWVGKRSELVRVSGWMGGRIVSERASKLE